LTDVVNVDAVMGVEGAAWALFAALLGVGLLTAAILVCSSRCQEFKKAVTESPVFAALKLATFIAVFALSFVTLSKYRPFRQSIGYVASLEENWSSGPLAGIELSYDPDADSAAAAAAAADAEVGESGEASGSGDGGEASTAGAAAATSDGDRQRLARDDSGRVCDATSKCADNGALLRAR